MIIKSLKSISESILNKLILLLFIPGLLLTACELKESQPEPSSDTVDAVLDDWHAAAAEGDFECYFNHF
jgi:hypothetical protein